MRATTPDMYAHEQTLQVICKRCRSHTRVLYVYEREGKLYADIRTELEDPRNLMRRFYKVGYQVNSIANMGGDHFSFEMVQV